MAHSRIQYIAISRKVKIVLEIFLFKCRKEHVFRYNRVCAHAVNSLIFFTSLIPVQLKLWRFFYGQNIKCKYITVMLYISMSCCIHQCCLCTSMSCCIHQCYVCIYQCHVVCTSVLCLYMSMSCCIHQCYIKGVYISFVRCKSSFKCHKSMLSVTYIFLAMWHQDQTS